MSAPDCVFCQIIKKKISSEMIYEDELIAAFKDINPQAPAHILVVPKKHITKFTEIDDDQSVLLGKMMIIAKKIAKENNFDKDGFRVVINEGKNGGQTIYHLHLHLLAGKRFLWPPG